MCNEAKELLPRYPVAPEGRCRHTQPAFNPPTYAYLVSVSLLNRIQSFPPPATRYVTRHKEREVAVIEASATDVDVRTPDFDLRISATNRPQCLAIQEDRDFQR